MKRAITERRLLEALRDGEDLNRLLDEGTLTPAARDKLRDLQRSGSSKLAGQGGQCLPSLGPGTVALGADHGGADLKDHLVAHVKALGYPAHDLGTSASEPVDYPVIAYAVAEAVQSGACWRGIIVDGAGIGSSIVANKVRGIRAALCHDVTSALNSRLHNDANILTLGGRLIGSQVAEEIVEAWLKTEFGGGRHKRRVDMIAQIEGKIHSSGK